MKLRKERTDLVRKFVTWVVRVDTVTGWEIKFLTTRKWGFCYSIYNICNSGSIVFINNYRYALQSHFGHGIVQCSPTSTAIQDLFHPKSWQTPVAAVTVYSAPDDGHGVVQCSPTLTATQDLFHPNSWQTAVAAVTVYSAPEDGRKGRPKHVEHTCSWQSVYTQMWHRKPLCIDSVLKHRAANRKRLFQRCQT